MPHESTVTHEDVVQSQELDNDGLPGDRSRAATSVSTTEDESFVETLMDAIEVINPKLNKSISMENSNNRASTPLKLTYVHEDQDEDESLSKSPANQSLKKIMESNKRKSSDDKQPPDEQDEHEMVKQSGLEDVLVIPQPFNTQAQQQK